MTWRRQVLFWGLILGTTIVLLEGSGLDLWVQDRLVNMETGQWMVDGRDPLFRLLFYTGVKGGLIAFGVMNLALYGLSFGPKRKGALIQPALRKGCLMVVLALIIVPVTIAELKAVTHVYCPAQIERYGGDKPYVGLFERYPASCQSCTSGRCFPAGHASGGFALMVLYHVFEKRRHKIFGLAIGLGLGWVMGGYQMMKGAHFLSHTVVSMLLSWILILCIVWGVTKVPTKGGKHLETATASFKPWGALGK